VPIPEQILDRIQEKADIVEVISKYVQLKKVGRSYKANCPFHSEKTPSFIVSPDKQIYHCFGCGAGGNVFSFVMKYENIQFPEAVEMLAEKTGVPLPRSSFRNEEVDSLAKELYRINDAAAGFFQSCLAGNISARQYLVSRGIGDEAVKKFRIGYASDSWDALLEFFKKKGIEPAAAAKSGLVIANDKGGYYDRFRNRIIFPIMDLKERTIGFGGRVMDSSLPKYINSPETVIYSKGKNLYGLNFSKDEIKKQTYALVVEGYLDFLIPYQAGVKNIIATLGTALTVDQIKLLKRFANTVIMVYDPDEAGEAASLRNMDLFISEGVNVYVAELAYGLDPDSYIRKFGTEDFLKMVKSSKNLFDYKLNKVAKRFDMRTSHGKTAIAGEMLPTIARVGNAVLKSALTKKLAEKLGVDEESLKSELRKVKPEQYEKRYTVTLTEAKKESNSAELMLLALLLDSGGFFEKIKKDLSPDEFRDTSIREIVSSLFAMKQEDTQVTPSKLISRLGGAGASADLVSEASGILETIVDKDRAIVDCVARVKKDNAKDRLERIQEAIRAAHAGKDEQKVKSLVSEYNSIVKTVKV
jgi:DNA primase